MRGINKVTLVGNLGKDPEVQYLESGIPLAKVTIATNERYKDKAGNWQDQTEWHNIVLWRGLAEVAEKYLKKGSMVYLEGKLRTRSWDDKDGNKRYTTEIVGDNLLMLDRKGEANDSAPSPAASVQQPATPANESSEDQTDDLPF